MAWQLGNIGDRAQSVALMEKLGAYVSAVTTEDRVALIKAQAPACHHAALDRFETALYAYADEPTVNDRQASALVAAASDVSTAGAGVAAVANRALPAAFRTPDGGRSAGLDPDGNQHRDLRAAVADLHLVSDPGGVDHDGDRPGLSLRDAVGGTTAPMQAVAEQLAGEPIPPGEPRVAGPVGVGGAELVLQMR